MKNRLRFMLSALDEASWPGELGLPSYRLHPLIGSLTVLWPMPFSGNCGAFLDSSTRAPNWSTTVEKEGEPCP